MSAPLSGAIERGISLGVIDASVPDDPAELRPELAQSLRARGIRSLAVAFGKTARGKDPRHVQRARNLLSDFGIHVAQYTGVNANLVHPDDAVRSEAVSRVKAVIPAAVELGARAINSGVGTCSAAWREYFYRPHGDNFTPAAEDRAVQTLERIAELIDDTDLMYTLEVHQLSTMRSAEVIRRLLDRVDHPRIRANFDPINLLDTPFAAYTNVERIREMVEIVGPRYAPTCHVKDMVVTDGMPQVSHEVAPGKGLVDVETILNAALRLPGDGPVDFIVEHLSPEDSVGAVEYVRQRVIAAGVPLI